MQAALETEFLHTRGRTGTLLGRYPVLSTGRADATFRTCMVDGQVVAACAVRRFTWQAADMFEGAMIGFVWTEPARRGHGHAAYLLQSVVEELTSAGLDFAVLWSGIEGFYERLGWQRGDPGLFTSVPGTGPARREPLQPLAPVALDRLRLASGQPRLARSAAHWQCVPIPATTTGCFCQENAYVLCGEANEERYVYEAHGTEAALSALWPRVTAGVSRVHVNDWTDGALSGWLAREAGVVFKPQRLAFWQLLAPRARQADWQRWHLPWFDRI